MTANKKLTIFTLVASMLFWVLLSSDSSFNLDIAEIPDAYRSYITCANEQCVENITFPAYHIDVENNTH